jgi:hypothetical protein
MSTLINFDHIPETEKEAEWFWMLKPLLDIRLNRENPLNSRLIQTLLQTEGSRNWKTLRDAVLNMLLVVKNGKQIFSRK